MAFPILGLWLEATHALLHDVLVMKASVSFVPLVGQIASSYESYTSMIVDSIYRWILQAK